MARTLAQQTRAFRRAVTGLVKRYQFRDRNETVAFGLSVSQAYALGALDRHGALTMGALAADLQLTVSTATRTVDPLAERGLVRREADPADRRVCRVALTPKGRRLWRRLEAELLEIDRSVLETLTPGERDAIVRAIELLTKATDAWRAEKAART